jgi:BirA family biotin operon repressor/biotin-[acetyl-CoA-carboxylase] ligase
VRLIRLDTTDSTMLEARRRLAAGESPPFTVIAKQQTGGVGRLGRPWSSPPGGWWLTVAASLPEDQRSLPGGAALEMAALVCTVCQGAMVAAMMPPDAPGLSIKWPNDVLAGDRKLAGVLMEVVTAGGAAVVLVGVGVNTNLDTSDLDAGVRDNAITLREFTGRDVEKTFAEACIQILARRAADTIERGGSLSPGALAIVRRKLWGTGRTVPITLPDGMRVQGRIEGITDDGDLLATIDGQQRTLRSVDQIG